MVEKINLISMEEKKP